MVTRYAWLSIAAALSTLALKTVAYLLTGSVGLLSDALESLVNLAAATLTLVLLRLAATPPDEGHAYGHSKAEYFASGAEGALILFAAGGICWTAWRRLGNPVEIEKPGLGVAISLAASAINFWVARVLHRAARQHGSIALEADAKHLMTDVWTSGGVVLGVGLVAVTGWQRLDPIVAFLVAVNIVWSGMQLLTRSAQGLLDAAWPDEDIRTLRAIVDRYAVPPIQIHALRTRIAGARRFVSMHVVVPGDWTIARGHEMLERLERDIRAAFPSTTVDTHIEPLEDPASFEDQQLDR
jgi:cation diffusion facilitator family transporter